MDTAADAIEAARRAVKADGLQRFVVRIVPLKRITSTATPPPEPLIEDE